MTVFGPPGLTLTPDQQSVVTLPWDTKALVAAGAGTGKTTTLVHRVARLTTCDGLGASDLLLLSFSRAAVRELRNRLETMAGTTGRVRAQTFDSWATSVLMQQNPQRTDLAGAGFNTRIRLATEAIDAGVLGSFEYEPPAHVIIDEIQDLVNPRREMVEALLDWLGDDAGFTVVGDSAQSVYGFQATDGQDETNRFLKWVRRTFEVTELTLGDNFRARTPQARIALPFGRRLNALPDHGEDGIEAARAVEFDLRSTLLGVPRFGDLQDTFVQDSLRCFDGTTAILSRTNGQALLLSRTLAEMDVDHRVQRSPQEKAAPVWLAHLLGTATGSTITAMQFTEIVSAVAMRADFDCERTWRGLRRIAPHGRDRLELNELCRVIAASRLPDELTAPEQHPLVVSSIHRAKGLEFDRVLIVEPDLSRDRDPAGIPEETRLLYVAMTRARDDMYRLDSPKTWMIRKDSRLDRCYIGGRQRWTRNGMEVTERDVCRERPPGVGQVSVDPVATQEYLLRSVHTGDDVELRRLHELSAPEESPPYSIHHEGVPVGEVSEQFRKDLWRLLKISKTWRIDNFPLAIHGLRIESLETVAGPAAFTERHGLGSRGVWVAPRLVGLSRFEWGARTAVEKGHENP